MNKFESKMLASPLHKKGLFVNFFDGDDSSPRAGESTSEMMQALITNLPSYMGVVNSQVGPQADAELATAQKISPAYSQLLNDLYAKFAPEMAKTGVNVENINRTGAAQTDLDILKGSGGDLTREAVKIDRELNPEFYKTREAASGKLAELLGSINMGDAMPEAERAINLENVRSGNLGNNSATNTVANAMSFGGARLDRQNALGNAINAATNFLAPSQGQFNPVATALNRPSTNTGESRFGGVEKPTDQAYQSGSGLMNNISSFQNNAMQINANRRDTLDRMNEVTSSL